MNRREFFGRCGLRIAQVSPFIGLMGMRFHPYATAAGGYSGWVTFFGRLVAFVPADGGKWFWFFAR